MAQSLQIIKGEFNVWKYVINLNGQINNVFDKGCRTFIANNKFNIDYGINGDPVGFDIGEISFYDLDGSEQTFATFDLLVNALSGANFSNFSDVQGESLAITSSVNSSTDNLNAGNSYTFTGTGELVKQSDVLITLFTDQETTVLMQFSTDNVNWDSTITKVGTSGFNLFTTAVKGVRYFRVVVTTDSLTTTVFRLHTDYGVYRQGNSPLNAILNLYADALVTRPTSFEKEVAMGKRQNTITLNKWGKVVVGTTALPVAIWGTAFNPLTSIITVAQTFTITYNNATDGLGTTGALTLLISYLDANDDLSDGIHVLSNTGSDVTSFTGKGINRVVVLSNGGAGWNTNNITFTATTDGTTQAQIPVLKSVTQQAIYHTPRNYNLLLEWMLLNARKDAGGGNNPKVTFNIYSWSRVTLTRYNVFEYRLDTQTTEGKEFENPLTLPFGGREVIWIETVSTLAGTNVQARFSGVVQKTT